MKKYQRFAIVISIVGLLLVLTGVTYSFFNYTRTGQANTVTVGRINFTSSQSNTINLTNVFPISREDAPTDNTNSSEVIISISGDTEYGVGVEYLVSVDDVHMEASLYKKLPIGIIITPEKTGELGTSDDDYFTNRGGNTSLYKVMTDIVKEDEYVLVGYIKPGAAEVNGTIGIRAFIDLDEIAISDTYDGTELDENGTTNDWVRGRTVLTTEEWNGLSGNNAVSFKVRVEANEGVWVPDPTTRNDIKNIYTDNTFTAKQKNSITEIDFIRMSEEMINTHTDLIDLTDENGEGMVKAWIEESKLYIASPGETYLPESSANIFNGFANVTRYNFNNINTSEVTDMTGMFGGNSSLVTLDVSGFDTSNVTSFSGMFVNCSSLLSMDLSYLDTRSITTITGAFSGCTNLTSVNLSGLGSDNLTLVGGIFGSCSNLKIVNMSGFDFGTNVSGLFYGATSLENVILTGADMSNVSSASGMFSYSSALHPIKNVIMDNVKFGATTPVSMFAGSYIENISLKDADMSNVTSLSYMFSSIGNLKAIDLSGLNIPLATDISYMLVSSTNLEKANLSNINAPRVNNMSSVFANCGNLKTVNLSGFNGPSVTNTQYLFANCSSLESVNMDNFVFGTTAYKMFYNADSTTLRNLESISLKNVDMSRVTSVDSMFYGCSGLKSIDLSGLNTSNISNTSNMFYGCSSLESINLNGFASTSGYIYVNTVSGAINAKSIDLSNTRISQNGTIFHDFSKLETVNLSGTMISGGSYPTLGMFSGANNLRLVNLSGSDLTSLYGMFVDCDAPSIKVIGSNMSNLTSIYGMFDGDSNLVSADLSELDVSHVTTMESMFRDCSSLTNLNLGSFSNSVVTTIRYMFMNCTSLKSVNLSGIDTSNVTDVYQTFSGCSNLETIYVSNSWDVSSVTSSTLNYGMFFGCTKLRGGNGTTFAERYAYHQANLSPQSAHDNTYAIIDTPAHQGYLTLAS